MFEEYPDIVSVKDLTNMLHIGKNTAYSLIHNGKIKSIRIGKVHKIPKINIINYINRLTSECSYDII